MTRDVPEYIVQGHRFNIFEDIGCVPALYNTPLTYFISNMWPIVIGLISAVYCVLTLRSFARRRLEFSQFINSNTSSMTLSRYFRLMALAMSEILLTTPLSIFTICLNATAEPIGPWRSWSDTHFDFSRIEQIPAVLWQSNHLLVISTQFTRWIVPLCAFIFFAFFGFADEAKKNYGKIFWIIGKGLGFEPHKPSDPSQGIGQFSKQKSESIARSPTLPTYSPSSFYPMSDIKRSDTFSTTDQTSVSDKDVEQTSSADLVSPTEASQPDVNRLGWKWFDSKYKNRRHSSYV